MSIANLIYPIDLSGVKASNRVEHQVLLGEDEFRAFAIPHGCFFTDGLVIRETDTNKELVRGTDYECTYYYDAVSKMCAGKEVTGAIVVSNKAIKPNLTISVNIVGGPYCTHGPLIAEALEDLSLDNRIVDWDKVINKPDTFTAAPHLNDVGDLYGFQFIIDQLSAINETMKQGVSTQVTLFNERVEAFRASITSQLNDHMGDKDNPHNVVVTDIDTYSQAEIDQLVIDINKSIAAIEPKLTDIRDDIESVNDDLQAAKETFTGFSTRQSALESSYSDIMSLLSGISDVNTSLIQRISAAESDIVLLGQQLTALGQRVNDNTDAISDLNLELDSLSSVVSTLNDSINTCNGEIDSIQQYLSNIDQSIDLINDSIAAIEQSGSYQFNLITDLQRRVATLEELVTGKGVRNLHTAIALSPDATVTAGSPVAYTDGIEGTADIIAFDRDDHAVISIELDGYYVIESTTYVYRNGINGVYYNVGMYEIQNNGTESLVAEHDNNSWGSAQVPLVLKHAGYFKKGTRFTVRVNTLINCAARGPHRFVAMTVTDGNPTEREGDEIDKNVVGVDTINRFNIDELFTPEERANFTCNVTFDGCKIGGGDRNRGSVFTSEVDYKRLNIKVKNGTKILGKGGNGGGAFASGCTQADGQIRTDGGHGITFFNNVNAYVYIEDGCTVMGGGAGGECGWAVSCGYSNSGAGGAGGGGAGYPGGLGGKNGWQNNGSCNCSTANAGDDGTETAGGEGGTATGYQGTKWVCSQWGANGGGLGEPARGVRGYDPLAVHGQGGMAVVGAKAVYNVTDID